MPREETLYRPPGADSIAAVTSGTCYSRAGSPHCWTMPVRLLVAIAILIAAFLAMFLVLIATETALTVWHYLRQAPLWVQLGYALILVGFPVAALAVFWTWFRPARKRRTAERPRPLSTEALEGELLSSAREGVDVSAAARAAWCAPSCPLPPGESR